ncbi:hypothetical protein P7K49_001418 [Saguinus oedipus]|uniref:Uncharacterized protein n=1 Tax=Saguinus oedipus TaxID=9490 RepID=A0ABQ9WEF9_SAGOE|nr:hypothetical protein P7K49_001418 [Saguinus oedipus]
MAPSVTQPPPPSLAAGHTHKRSLQGKTPAGEARKVCFPPHRCLPPAAPGARGRQRVNPCALAPPSAPARSPAFSVRAHELRSSPRRGRRTLGPGPAGGHHYMQVIGGEGARRGLCLLLPGSGSSAPGGSSSSCPCSPLPPSSNLTFRGGGGGGRGVPACAARAVGRVCSRRRPAARSCAAGGVRAGERSPRSQVTHGSGEKPWREKGAGAQHWAHYCRPRPRPALRLNRRRGAAAARLHSAPRGAARLGGRDCTKDGAGRRAAGGAEAGGKAQPGERSDFLPASLRLHVGRLM